MCRFVRLVDCGFDLEYSQQGIADGIAWDTMSEATLDQMIEKAVEKKVDIVPVLKASTVQKKQLCLSGARG